MRPKTAAVLSVSATASTVLALAESEMFCDWMYAAGDDTLLTMLSSPSTDAYSKQDITSAVMRFLMFIHDTMQSIQTDVGQKRMKPTQNTLRLPILYDYQCKLIPET